jgi:hypothetical protein
VPLDAAADDTEGVVPEAVEPVEAPVVAVAAVGEADPKVENGLKLTELTELTVIVVFLLRPDVEE